MIFRRLGIGLALWALLSQAALAGYPGTAPLIVANGGTGATTLTQYGVLIGEGTGAFQATSAGTSGIPLIGQGSANPVFGTAVVGGGGTGDTTLAQYGVLVGAGTAAVQVVGSSSTADAVLLWQASGANPVAGPVNNCATALTYSTSSHAFGCNASTGTVPSVSIYTTSNATVTLASTNELTTAFNQSGTKATTIDLPASPASGLLTCVKDAGNGFASTIPTVKTTDSTTIDGVTGTTGYAGLNQNKANICFIYDGTSNWEIQ